MAAGSERVLRAGWVVPVSAAPIRDGWVAVRGGRITALGGAAERPEGPVEELGPGVLLPGLVNAHCHLELSALRGLDGSRGFTAWVGSLVEARPRLDPQRALAAASAAIRSLEASGSVALGDVSNTLAHLELLAASRLACVVFFELLGWDPARAEAILLAADARLASLGGGRPAPNVELRLAAHAPHSTSPALLAGLASRGGPAALHLAESPEEARFLAAGDGPWAEFLRERVGDVPFRSPGTSPVRYLAGLGLLRRGMLAVHCVQVDAEDRRLLAAAGVHVVLCPRSNQTLGVGRAPAEALRAAGVPLALGTDSLASVPSLDLAEEMAALHREQPLLPAEAIVRMATEGGARALGLAGLGAIAPGKQAALAYAAADAAPLDPFGFLVSGEARPARVEA